MDPHAPSTSPALIATSAAAAQRDDPNELTPPSPAPVPADFSAKVPFSSLCELFERLSKESAAANKKHLIKTFLSHYLDQYFPVMRLMLPKLDKERTYGMKETLLAGLYMECLGIARESEDGKRLCEWRKGKVCID